MSYRGSGDLQTIVDAQWCSNELVSDPPMPLLRRCASIPVKVWHQAVVPNQNWAVVSFHTVPAHELIEERPEPRNCQRLVQKNYVSKAADMRETTAPCPPRVSQNRLALEVCGLAGW